MPHWVVVKTGHEMFDFLHASGLGIFLANALDTSVELCDQGLSYELSATGDVPAKVSADLITKILRLPKASDLDKNQDEILLANWDGLLAALFTVPGVRAVSVADLWRKERRQPGMLLEGLHKTQQGIARWRKYIERSAKGSACWFTDLLKAYVPDQPTLPKLVCAKKTIEISVLMTLEPAFGYAPRRTLSDTNISDRNNLTVADTPYATILAFIGAARLLRAQRVNSNFVNFYLALAKQVTLDPDIAKPRLYAIDGEWRHVLSHYWLQEWFAPAYQCCGLTFQVLQTQGAKQSVSHWRGTLEYNWLDQVAVCVGTTLIRGWLRILTKALVANDLIESLVDFLFTRRAVDLQAHLYAVALYIYAHGGNGAPAYSVNEVKGMSMLVKEPTPSPLRSVMAREGGTLRFGHALRLLGRQNRSALRDVIEELTTVSTRDDLIRRLIQAVQACHLANAHTDFIIIPSDDDLDALLEDVECLGAKAIANLLMLLAILHYPPRTEEKTGTEPMPEVVGIISEEISNERAVDQ